MTTCFILLYYVAQKVSYKKMFSLEILNSEKFYVWFPILKFSPFLHSILPTSGSSDLQLVYIYIYIWQAELLGHIFGVKPNF